MTTEIRQGARTHYGPRETEDKASGKVRTSGHSDELRLSFKYDDLPSPAELDAVFTGIPADAIIEAAEVYVHADFDSTSGTTTIDIGLQEDDGTEIDNDGLVVDLTADGSNAGWTSGAGALVGATIGSVKGYPVVTASVDDLTAGVASVIIRYRQAPVATPSV